MDVSFQVYLNLGKTNDWVHRFNESLRLNERNFHFSVNELKKTAANVVNLRKIGKGGFNRVFEVTIDDQSVIARLPYPCTYPKHFTIASEVATINLVRSYGIPAPKILAYSATSDNAVGSEYSIMEKAEGRDLGDIWYDTAERERLRILSQVGKLRKIFFSIELPAYASNTTKAI
jgi:predicted Ser/Thr protein kinase